MCCERSWETNEASVFAVIQKCVKKFLNKLANVKKRSTMVKYFGRAIKRI